MSDKYTIYSKDGRAMYSVEAAPTTAQKFLLEWPEASFMIHESTKTEIILREDCKPCVVSAPKDEPGTKK